eukprot:TRINITY_DN9840_c0_g1_i1.p1 TRINITY_DN9840_c0_g1~~TRINITY_DN9840_c0_g1_i1.p1  ORF type:complete len:122 (+),score=23.56 TRINITY_DN9840_c0_g1_i1:282-647(+)
MRCSSSSSSSRGGAPQNFYSSGCRRAGRLPARVSRAAAEAEELQGSGRTGCSEQRRPLTALQAGSGTGGWVPLPTRQAEQLAGVEGAIMAGRVRRQIGAAVEAAIIGAGERRSGGGQPCRL